MLIGPAPFARPGLEKELPQLRDGRAIVDYVERLGMNVEAERVWEEGEGEGEREGEGGGRGEGEGEGEGEVEGEGERGKYGCRGE